MQFFPQPATHVFETPGNGSIIYCTISDGKTANFGVCPQSQQWEQLEGLHVTKSCHCSTSFSPKTLWTMSDLTPGSDFPKWNLHCQRGFCCVKDQVEHKRKMALGSPTLQQQKPNQVQAASCVLSFCCANNAVSHLREPGWKSLPHLVFSGVPAHGLAPCAIGYVSINLDAPKPTGSPLNGPNTSFDWL